MINKINNILFEKEPYLMGALFNACGPTSHLNANAVGQGGVSGNINQIDDAALAAIKNGIGEANKAALKQII
jgi:hypothetical protein